MYHGSRIPDNLDQIAMMFQIPGRVVAPAAVPVVAAAAVPVIAPAAVPVVAPAAVPVVAPAAVPVVAPAAVPVVVSAAVPVVAPAAEPAAIAEPAAVADNEPKTDRNTPPSSEQRTGNGSANSSKRPLIQRHTRNARDNADGDANKSLHDHQPSSAAPTSNGRKAAAPELTSAPPPPKSVALMKIKTYLLALRPWSLSASLVPTILGSALAYRTPGPFDFSPLTFVLTVFTVITVHGAGNVVNTYFDFVKGIDNRKSDDRTLVDHILSKDEVVSLGAILYMAGCVGFIALAILSPAKMEHLALVYFGGLSSSFLYTGGIGLKYIALGDVLILVIFGPISVLFAYMAQTGRLEWTTIYFAIPLALNTEAILHSNNTRDADTDRRAGIVTLAILIGRTASHILYALLLFTPYSVFVVLSLKYSAWFLLPLVTVPHAFRIEKRFRNAATVHGVPKQTARLNFFFGILYVVSCCCAPQLPLIARRY